MPNMTCKGYLRGGTKLGKVVDRLLEVVKLPPSPILTPINANIGWSKKNMFHQHYRLTSFEQLAIKRIKK